ncbi:MAG TPA: S9 family peptidase [Gemmatimonadaceae bacterium]|nr:S9 family peptidase [Gemmatimonadaceae bacterium]
MRRLLRSLVRTAACAVVVPGLLRAQPTMQQATPTPAPQDIPQPVPGDVGLAGSDSPDIARFLNARSASSPSLSPDGTRLSYITSTTGQPQLWAVAAGGGTPVQLTFNESSVTFQEWSPAGEWIAYGTDRAGNEREGFYLVSPDGLRERELLAPAEAFRVFGGWSPDGRRVAFASTERNGEDFDIYVMDVAADGTHGAPRRVHEGRGGVYVAAWRPDGGALVLTRSRGEADNDVFLLDLRSGRAETLFEPADGAAYDGFSWTPDGRGFYLATNQDRDLSALAFYDVASRRLSIVEAPAREVEGVALSKDGRYLAWTVNDNGYSRLTVRDLAAKREVPASPPLPPGVYGIHFADAAPVLSVRVGGPQLPGDVWTLDARTGRAARATVSASGGLDPATFVVPEAVSFRSWDGETIHGLLYLPRAARAARGGRPPVVLGVHGGPTAQARPAYSPAFQYLLTKGIAVLDLNFRGSTGYGKRFTRLDNGRLRPNAVKDMAGALDWLATTGKVDASRAAVMGGSYGGYLTFAAMTQLPDRFRAGVGFVGVANWLTALEGASPQLKASDKVEYGNVDDPADRQFFVELSPITHVKNVRAPLMVLHGANDPRDPVTEADQLVRAIRAQGGEVEYLRFPDEGHGIRKLTNRITAYRRIARFLERTLDESLRS